jgi:uncharacterized membrane protein (UPF0127 family)
LISLLLLTTALLAQSPASLILGGTVVSAEVADTPTERAQGLMGRVSLPTNSGMLFVYPDEGIRSFWMQNTPLPLSIAFMDKAGQVVHITDLVPLETDPKNSELPAMYALEMTRGWFEAHNVRVGQSVAGLPNAATR